MQEILETAARWYMNETGFTLEQMQNDLRGILHHREKAFADGDLERVYRVFAYTEIIKAAICLVQGHEYDTAFSRFELGLIKKYSNNGKSTFVCPKCGREYPAEAFAPGSKFCISCDREIRLLRQKEQKSRTGGYVNRCGEIICAAE